MSQNKYESLRETKEAEWCGRKITVKEVMVSDIIELQKANSKEEAKEKIDDSLSSTEGVVEQLKNLCKTTTGLDLMEVLEYPPSKIKKLILLVESVNEDFFWITGCFGLTKKTIRAALENIVRNHVTMASLNLFKS